MKKSLVLVVFSCLLAVFGATAAVFSPPPASAPAAKVVAATAADLISQGKSALQLHQQGSILTARSLFAQAVSADPNNQEANLLYGVTRALAIFEQEGSSAGIDSVREIFEASGFSFQTFGLYDVNGSDPDGVAPTTPRTGVVLDFVKLKVLPEIDLALANLAKVTDTSFSSTLTPAAMALNGGANINVDYADALILKALLNVVKCNLNLLMVYGLDVGIPDIAAAPDQLLTYKQLFAADANLLRVKDAARMVQARGALIGFIDSYKLALDRIPLRPVDEHHLFVVDAQVVTNEPVAADFQSLSDFSDVLTEIRAALDGPKLLSFVSSTENRDRTVDLSKFFISSTDLAPIDIRARLGNCSTGTMPGDDTIGGLFPLGLSAYQDGAQEIGPDLLGVVCTGWERPKIEVSPDYIWFNDYPGYSSGPYNVAIRNFGTGPLNSASITLAGANSGDFTLRPGSCGSALAAGSSCSATVDLKRPVVASGSRSATLLVAGNGEPMGSAEIFGWLNPGSGASISGLARDASGEGVAAQVTLYNAQSGAQLRSTSTNHTGGYAFTGLAAGSYKLYFSPYHSPALGRWYNDKDDQSGANTVQLAVGQNIYGVDFLLSPGAALSVQFSGSGWGTVTSVPAGITCYAGDDDCRAEFPQGGVVSLTPTASGNSLFAGWAGACSGTGNCLVTMDSAKSVTVSFNLRPATVRIGDNATLYHSIGAALDASGSGTVRARDVIFPEHVLLDHPATILLKGGFTDGAFSLRSSTSFTVLDGSLKVRNGTLKAERLRLR